MNRQKYFVFFLVAFVLSAVALAYPTKKASAHGDDSQLIAESSLLAGLAPGAVFPFIDTTPHRIAQAHIAITDSTSDCHTGAAPPDNIKVLVGEAGVAHQHRHGLGNGPRGQFRFRVTPARPRRQ